MHHIRRGVIGGGGLELPILNLREIADVVRTNPRVSNCVTIELDIHHYE